MATQTFNTSPVDHDAGTNEYLNPLPQSRLRIASDEHDDEDGPFEATTQESLNSSYSNLRDGFDHYQSKRELILSYLVIAIEGDLAGFQIAWVAMSTGFILLKIFDITDVIQTIQWWAIFVIPILNAVLTAWFDYIIRKYRSINTVESLRKARFFVLWAVKVIFAIYVTTYWIWGSGSFMERFEDREDYQEQPQACTGQTIVIYICLLAAVCMSEVMITTVLINSEQNLSVLRTPMKYRFILLIIRPFVWVYNRTMVMFLCFYAIYGLFYSLFVVGFLCDMYCDSFYSKENQKVGLQMLLVPFTVPSYLMNIDQIFNSWDDTKDDKFLETFVIVFLCQSFYVDCLNSLWQFSRRYLKPSKSLEQSKSVHGLQSPKDKAFLSALARELPPSTPDGRVPQSMTMEQQLSASNNVETVSLK